jgi:seryl-tRNA synthetase
MSYSTEDLRDLIIELDKKIERVITNVETIKAKQEELNTDISKIKDPENGLFPRVKSLEEWRTTHSRITWAALSALIALAAKQLWDLITFHAS